MTKHDIPPEQLKLYATDPAKFQFDFVERAKKNINQRTTIYVKVPTTITLKQLNELLFWSKDRSEFVNDFTNDGEEWSMDIWLFVKNDYLEKALLALAQIGGHLLGYEAHNWSEE